jgi:hypothetical protein
MRIRFVRSGHHSSQGPLVPGPTIDDHLRSPATVEAPQLLENSQVCHKPHSRKACRWRTRPVLGSMAAKIQHLRRPPSHKSHQRRCSLAAAQPRHASCQRTSPSRWEIWAPSLLRSWAVLRKEVRLTRPKAWATRASATAQLAVLSCWMRCCLKNCPILRKFTTLITPIQSTTSRILMAPLRELYYLANLSSGKPSDLPAQGQRPNVPGTSK